MHGSPTILGNLPPEPSAFFRTDPDFNK